MYSWKYSIKFDMRACTTETLGYCYESFERPGYCFKRSANINTIFIYTNVPPHAFFHRCKDIPTMFISEINVKYIKPDDIINKLKTEIKNQKNKIDMLNDEVSINISTDLKDIQQREKILKEGVL